jgi:hypothetical protein
MVALGYTPTHSPILSWTVLECAEVQRSARHIEDHIHAMLVLK